MIAASQITAAHPAGDAGDWRRVAWVRVVKLQWQLQRTLDIGERVAVFLQTAAESGVPAMSYGEAGVAHAYAKQTYQAEIPDTYHPLNRPPATEAGWFTRAVGSVTDWIVRDSPILDDATRKGEAVWRQRADAMAAATGQNPADLRRTGSMFDLLSISSGGWRAQAENGKVPPPVFLIVGVLLAAWLLLRR